MTRLIIFFLALFLFAACKNEPKEQVSALEDRDNITFNEQAYVNDLPENPIQLPDPCSLISKDELSEMFGVPVSDITIKKGLGGQGQGPQNTSSCFMTWEKGGDRGGFLLQLMKNPLYGEFDGWAASYIDVLEKNGETSYPDNIQYKYTPFEGLGDAAVFNNDLDKVFWRNGEELVVGMIFRSPLSNMTYEEIGKKVGALINPRIKLEKK